MQPDIDAIRKRPGMYIGAIDDGSAVHRMVREVVANAVNEALEGYADLIEITLNPDGSVTVSDNGRGIPVDIDEHEWLSIAELVMTRTYAGITYSVANHGRSSYLHSGLFERCWPSRR
jgi:DNA gyrase subunit B